MNLEIVTPLGMIFDDKIAQITLPGSEGEFSVLPEHSKLVTLLNAGLVTILLKDKKEISVAINSGYVKVTQDKVSCIVEGAVAIDKENNSFKESLKEAKELLNSIQINNNMEVYINKIDNL